MLKILYEDDPNLPLICLPLLVYHPTQILLGGLLVPHLRSYLKRKDSGWENTSGIHKTLFLKQEKFINEVPYYQSWFGIL